tara:strand:+ start:386 stop:523 length:138 start_codon:yes stop_codon:yes gene_type:complete
LGVAFCRYGCTTNSTGNNNENDKNIIKIFFKVLLPKVEDIIYAKV